MKKKRSTRFRHKFTDLISILFCLCGMAAALYLLYKDMNSTYQKDDEPAGVVYFKKNSAQRCFSGRNLWERLKEETPVYKGDRIRTKENSQVFIVFSDSRRIDLDENTLIRIPEDSDNEIDFISGSLILNSTKQNQDKPMIIRAGTKIITLEKNTSVVLNFNPADGTDDGYIKPVLYVKSGAVSVSDSENKNTVQKVSSGEIVTFKTKITAQDKNDNPYIPDSLKEVMQDVNQKINESEVVTQVTNVIKKPFTGEENITEKTPAAPTSKESDVVSIDLTGDRFNVLMPPENYKITQSENHKEKIPFYWSGAQKIRIEFAYDKNFNTVVDTQRISSRDKKGFVVLDYAIPGDVLYWRATDDSKEFKKGFNYPLGKINVSGDYQKELKAVAGSVFGKDKADGISKDVQSAAEINQKAQDNNLSKTQKAESTKTVFVDTGVQKDFNQAVKEIRKEAEKKKEEATKIQKQKEEAELKAQKQAEKKRLEAQKKAAQKREAERKKAEKTKKEREKKEAELREKERLEKERLEKERQQQAEEVPLEEPPVEELPLEDDVPPAEELQPQNELPLQQDVPSVEDKNQTDVKPEESEPADDDIISDELLKRFKAPDLKKPENKTVFKTPYFKAQAKPEIKFEWTEIQGAKSYTIVITDSKDKVLLEKEVERAEFTLRDDISILGDGGTFKWYVTANAKTRDGITKRKSSVNTIKIDLGKLSTVEIDSSNLITE